MRRTVRASAALLALALSACGGGRGNATHALPAAPAATAAATTAAQGVAKFSLLIPNAATTAKLTRKAQYISASTLSGTIAAGANPATELDLGSGSPLCTTVTNGRTCAIAVNASIGSNVTFTVKLYDGMFSGGVHTGTLLSSGTFTSSVAEGASNVTVPLILAGVLASYKIVITQQPAIYDTTSVGTLVFDGYDPDNKLIIGSGTLTNASGTPISVVLAAIPANSILYSIDGGAYGASGSIANTSDTITFKQSTSIIGAQIVPTAIGATSLATAWVRPTGFSSQYVEGNLISSSGTNQIMPFADIGKGVAVVAENAPGGGIFTASTGDSFTSPQCSGPLPPALDVAYEDGIAWMAGYGGGTVLSTVGGTGTCSGASQAVADTVVTIPTVGIEYIVFDGAATCTSGTMVPGVYVSAGAGVASCSLPHDLVATSDGTGYVALETNTFGGFDHAIGFNGVTFAFDRLIKFGTTTAAGQSLVSEAMRSDNNVYMHDLGNNRLWSLGFTTQQVNGFVALPSTYTYVNHQQSAFNHAYSARSMAIGSDGLAYIAISSPLNGLLVVDPDTGAAVSVLPNVSGASSSGVQQVVADGRGSIYWSAGVYLMHYPSGLP